MRLQRDTNKRTERDRRWRAVTRRAQGDVAQGWSGYGNVGNEQWLRRDVPGLLAIPALRTTAAMRRGLLGHLQIVPLHEGEAARQIEAPFAHDANYHGQVWAEIRKTSTARAAIEVGLHRPLGPHWSS
ncbi:MAG: hypothetical protein AMJ93_16265 [Anaerolineae bacterium SM23_84]|nr:MAG: hypothetical protein AMJ93_16265 [Anaerolineae bacterium SM23_84]